MSHTARVPFVSRLACLCAAAFAVGCGGTPTATSCPVVSSTCPSPAPSYADVAPIIQQECVPCHAPTGVEPNRPYQTYAELTAPGVQIDILTQLRDCKMPQPGAPPLSDDDRATLLAWLYCDAPLDGGAAAVGADH